MANNAENVSIWWRHHEPQTFVYTDSQVWSGHVNVFFNTISNQYSIKHKHLNQHVYSVYFDKRCSNGCSNGVYWIIFEACDMANNEK